MYQEESAAVYIETGSLALHKNLHCLSDSELPLLLPQLSAFSFLATWCTRSMSVTMPTITSLVSTSFFVVSESLMNLQIGSHKKCDYQRLNFVLDYECCCCEQPISAQKFFLLQFHWMLTITTFAIQHKIQLLMLCQLP